MVIFVVLAAAVAVAVADDDDDEHVLAYDTTAGLWADYGMIVMMEGCKSNCQRWLTRCRCDCSLPLQSVGCRY